MGIRNSPKLITAVLIKAIAIRLFFHFSIFQKIQIVITFNSITFIIKYETKMTTDSPAQKKVQAF